jgi:chromosome partitioning protein
LFTRTSAAIRPRTLKSIEDEFFSNGVPVFATRLTDREPYRALFSYGGTLSGLNPKVASNLKVAIANAQDFAREVVAMLKPAASGAGEGGELKSDALAGSAS